MLLRLFLSAVSYSVFFIVGSNFLEVPLSFGVICFDALLLWGVCLTLPLRGNIRLAVGLPLSLFFIVENWSLFLEAAYSMSLWELWGIASFFWWGQLLFVFVPLFQLTFALLLIWDVIKKQGSFLSVRKIVVAVIGTLLLHFCSANLQNRQPILDFPTYNFVLQQTQPGHLTRNEFLQEDIKRTFDIVSNKNLKFVDAKPEVMILVESWGVRRNFSMNVVEFDIFSRNDIRMKGLWKRSASFTQAAEFEDFGLKNKPDEISSNIEILRSQGLDTWYIHGFDGSFYERKSNYGSIGFSHMKFKEDFAKESLKECHYGNVGFEGICDSSLVVYIDSLLTDSVLKFIYWTTLDSHPPYDFQQRPESTICNGLEDVECIHAVRIRNTLSKIAILAQKHPEYRFVIRGDHRPMGALTSKRFITSFYYSWVPIIVLN